MIFFILTRDKNLNMNKLEFVSMVVAIVVCLVGCRGDVEDNVSDDRVTLMIF